MVLEVDLDAEYDEEAGRHGGHGRRQRLGAEAEGEPAPGRPRLEGAMSFRHELGPQVSAEVRVQRRRGRAGQLQQVHDLAVRRVLEELLELGILAHVNPASNSGGNSRRSRSTARWRSSLTAPALLPMIWAISSIFLSSPNLSTMAARW